MKKVILSTCLVACSMSVMSQNKMTSSQYLEQYKDFVVNVESHESITHSEYHSLDSVYTSLTSKYKLYKKGMTASQVGEYNELKNRYRRRIIKYRGQRFSNGVEETGDSVGSGMESAVNSAGNGIRKTGATVGGFFKGMFGSSKSKTDKKK